MQEEPQWEPLTCGIAETRDLSQINDPWQSTLVRWMDQRLDCVTQGPQDSFHGKMILLLFLFCLFFKFGFDLWGRLQGKRTNSRRLGDKRNQNAWCEIHKKSIKVKKQKTVVTFRFLIHIFLLQITNYWLVMASNLLKMLHMNSSF